MLSIARRDNWDLRAVAIINVDYLHRWDRPFPLSRLFPTPSGHLGSSALPQIASVERVDGPGAIRPGLYHQQQPVCQLERNAERRRSV